MAVKNYKRNGRRSKTIVFALFMSVVVFLSVSNFSLMFSDVMKQSYSSYSDLTVSVEYQDAKKLDKALAMTTGVDKSFCLDHEYSNIDKDIIQDKLFTNDMVILAFVDNVTFDSYLMQLGEDTAKYHDIKNPTGVLHNVAVTRDGKKKVKVEPFVDLTGKKLETKLSVFTQNTDTEESIDISPIVGLQTTVDYKDDDFHYQNMHLPIMWLSIDMAEQYFSQSDQLHTNYSADIFCDDAEAVEAELWDPAFKEVGIKSAFCYNATSEMDAINNILTIVKVFVFGFITLITLISIMNIVNTISNSMNERRREFAMIRSVGMTPKSFKKMVYYESFRYGLMSLIWSIPISEERKGY